jgi:hypothetical protein
MLSRFKEDNDLEVFGRYRIPRKHEVHRPAGSAGPLELHVVSRDRDCCFCLGGLLLLLVAVSWGDWHFCSKIVALSTGWTGMRGLCSARNLAISESGKGPDTSGCNGVLGNYTSCCGCICTKTTSSRIMKSALE